MNAILKNPEKLLAWGAVALVAYVVIRGPQGAAKDAVKGSLDLLNEAAAGSVKGIGEAVGVPDTNKTQCQVDKERGDKWGASFSCSAGEYIKFLVNGY